jgi:hypothetical protein
MYMYIQGIKLRVRANESVYLIFNDRNQRALRVAGLSSCEPEAA